MDGIEPRAMKDLVYSQTEVQPPLLALPILKAAYLEYGRVSFTIH